MKKGFFTRLALALFNRPEKPITAAHLAQIKRELAAKPELQRFAQNEATNRRLHAHAQACFQGYRAKLVSVSKGKGRNTIQGIPAWAMPEGTAS